MSKRVLCVVADGFEEIELVTPVDLLRRAGADVVMASIGGAREVTGRCGVRIVADALLNEVDAAGFDLLFIPGGPGVNALRADGRAAKLASEFAGKGKPVTAICAAPTVLGDAGLLGGGRRFTAHDSVYGELPGASRTDRVVVDGGVITSRGAGTALDFGLALVRQLFGEGAAGEIAKSVMA